MAIHLQSMLVIVNGGFADAEIGQYVNSAFASTQMVSLRLLSVDAYSGDDERRCRSPKCFIFHTVELVCKCSCGVSGEVLRCLRHAEGIASPPIY